jgi:hypothetical protein
MIQLFAIVCIGIAVFGIVHLTTIAFRPARKPLARGIHRAPITKPWDF